jgi:hypothetical protein
VRCVLWWSVACAVCCVFLGAVLCVLHCVLLPPQPADKTMCVLTAVATATATPPQVRRVVPVPA